MKGRLQFNFLAALASMRGLHIAQRGCCPRVLSLILQIPHLPAGFQAGGEQGAPQIMSDQLAWYRLFSRLSVNHSDNFVTSQRCSGLTGPCASD